MKRGLIIFMLSVISVFAVGCGGAGQNNPSLVSIPDDDGEVRLVSTSVALVEILDQLGVDYVGIPKTSRQLPESARGKTVIGSPMGPDMEILKQLDPTEIISPLSLEGDLVDKYKQFGLPATFLDLDSIDGMKESILYIGEKYGKSEKAKQIVDEFNKREQEAVGMNQEEEAPRVLIVFGFPGTYLIATEQSYVGDLVSKAGGVNVLEDDSTGYVSVNLEALVQTQPDIILRTAHALPEECMAMLDEEFSTNPLWSYFIAVQEDRVYDLDSALCGVSANLNTIDAIEYVADVLYNQ